MIFFFVNRLQGIPNRSSTRRDSIYVDLSTNSTSGKGHITELTRESDNRRKSQWSHRTGTESRSTGPDQSIYVNEQLSAQSKPIHSESPSITHKSETENLPKKRDYEVAARLGARGFSCFRLRGNCMLSRPQIRKILKHFRKLHSPSKPLTKKKKI